MSRFVGAQRLAFQKLLKKYKKWTGSADLGKRFREGVLDRPTSFSKRDLQPLLAQWTQVLASVRAPFDRKAGFHPANAQAKARKNTSGRSQPSLASADTASSSAEDLHSTWETGSNVDIDTALAILPLGPSAARAVYWIHPDNIVQIHVLLLQYTRLPKSKNTNASLDTPPSSRSSPRGSLSANTSRPFPRTDEEVGNIVCDDPQRFAQRRNCETISEDKAGTVAHKAAASIRYSCGDDAVAVVGIVPDNASKPAESQTRLPSSKAKVDRKTISHLFNPSKADQIVNRVDSEDCMRVCRWLKEHIELQPLVRLQSRRTRFVGLKNDKKGGIWATLDTDVLMTSSSRGSVADGRALITLSEGEKQGASSFPHAILEVRIEGDSSTEIISDLDASYLVGDPYAF